MRLWCSAFCISGRRFLVRSRSRSLQYNGYAKAENEAPKVQSIRGRELVRRPESVRSVATEIGSAMIYEQRLQVEGDRGPEELLEILACRAVPGCSIKAPYPAGLYPDGGKVGKEAQEFLVG
jgi:hypothetical protein